MRAEPNTLIDEFRREHPTHGWTKPGSNTGFFVVGALRIIASQGCKWDHVSVTRCDMATPTWDEMCLVKDLFWSEDETVVQFHPRKSSYINCHPSCLHLWKRQNKPWGLPPGWMVGPTEQMSEVGA